MPLSKRRKLFTPKKNGKKPNSKESEEQIVDSEVSTARGRLKGALMEMMEPTAEESDASSDYTPAIPTKRERLAERQSSPKQLHWYQRPHRRDNSQDHTLSIQGQQKEQSVQRQSYVLKLFDRSVDLSQFSEDSPLYPICRAWIANQPKANYNDFIKQQDEEPPSEDSIELPGPEGPVISRIPSLLPEQIACSKDNINLNYNEAPPPSREQLLHQHMSRWVDVRNAWLQQSTLVESRYSATQAVLNKIAYNNSLS